MAASSHRLIFRTPGLPPCVVLPGTLASCVGVVGALAPCGVLEGIPGPVMVVIGGKVGVIGGKVGVIGGMLVNCAGDCDGDGATREMAPD